MSSSSEAAGPLRQLAHAGPALGATHQGAVLPRHEVGELDPLPTPELRSGAWTSHGDHVTESLLGQVAAEVRSTAQAQGYSVGWSQGSRAAQAAVAEEAAAVAREVAARNAEAEQRRAEEHAAAIAALGKAADDVRDLLVALSARVEEQATTLAWELTSTLVERELAVADDADVVRRVLQVLPETGVATVRLHPATADADAVAALRGTGLSVIPDPSLGRADALVECDGSVADLRIAEAIERVRRVLA
ncbi:FliH/SctL family protein [Nocardioides sp. BP30]|uniref:FliH/SctL family protein n=1 Tax=Nocardioides sp. BP30 TaxID=3036374 RepID=UPI002468F1D5|nr:FliH/SctL family protein [Nocardioides sp. BP30]WGL51935.1 FliH/SctL family protein [Nocardioides sp. BP30]